MTGCASVTQGTEQSVKVDTLDNAGRVITGAECKLSNDKGSSIAKSGDSAVVRRSGGNLALECNLAGQPAAVGQAISRANAGVAGNVLLGGVIGVAIDVGTGAAYTYPTWVQLVFGEERVFDRSGNRTDDAVAGAFVRATTTDKTAAMSPVPVAPTAPVAAPPVAVPPVAATPVAAPPPAPRSEVARSANPSARTPLQRGDALEYTLVDRLTGNRSTVVYRLDRIDADRLVFNQGTRVENKGGQLVSLTSPIGGLFDTASPPKGWGRQDLKSGMRWREEYIGTTGDHVRHELDAFVLGNDTVRIEGEEFQVSRIEYTGWIYASAGVGSIASRLPIPFKATALYSADLGRVVQFDSEFGRRSAFTQESIQLTRVLR